MKIKEMTFKGNLRKKRYFEGWYYKLVSKNLKHSLSIISGISLNKIDPHAFIQVVYSNKSKKEEELITKYISFNIDDFKYDYVNSIVSIGANSFGLDKMNLDIDEEEIKIAGKLDFLDLTPIKTSFLSPSIMGYFAYMPFMECIHAIVSMDHDLIGKILLNDQEIDFTGGKGYIEKDLGKSFPESYIWMQTNNFKDKKASFMLSYATVPFLFFKFKGLIANLVVDDMEYRFATYNRSKIKIREINPDEIKLYVKKGKYLLFIEAFSKKVHTLPSPKDGKMSNTIDESLMGEVRVTLYENDNLIFEGMGENAGIEMMLKK